MNDNSIGALWKHESEKGDYMTGNIEVAGEKIKIVIFKNKYKKDDTHPDYRIFISKPRKEADDGTAPF